MALPMKAKVTPEIKEQPATETERIVKLEAQIEDINEHLQKVLKQIAELTPKQIKTIHKMEAFNGDIAPEVVNDQMKMTLADKLISMKNAATILPPNFIVNGRHTRENIQAIVGFLVSEEMMDELYLTFSHRD